MMLLRSKNFRPFKVENRGKKSENLLNLLRERLNWEKGKPIF